MSNESVNAIALSEGQANRIVDSLNESGYSSHDIFVLFPNKDTTREFSHERNTRSPEAVVAGAATGGAIGGTVGLLAGIGALAIPGVGPLIAGGPLLAALTGAAAGVTVGGIAGSLIGLGIPEIEANRYEDRISEGNIFISVLAEPGEDASMAKDVLEDAGAEDISVTSINEIDAASRYCSGPFIQALRTQYSPLRRGVLPIADRARPWTQVSRSAERHPEAV